jgi:hypothetical protein
LGFLGIDAVGCVDWAGERDIERSGTEPGLEGALLLGLFEQEGSFLPKNPVELP